MSVSIQIYSNANSSSTSIDVDFVGGVLVESFGSPSAGKTEYYIKMATSNRTNDNNSIPVAVMKDLSNLALNGNVQSYANVTSAYSSIDAMITDYAYDLIHGHSANQFNSGCSFRDKMKIG